MHRFFVFVTVWMQILTPEVESACGGVIQSHYGTITSPGYPSNYPEKQNCLWNITGPPGSRIMLFLMDFDLDCLFHSASYDFVQMYFDGNSTDRLCGGKNRSRRWLTKANRFDILFQSHFGRNTQRRGFRLVWKGVGKTFLTSSNATWSESQEVCSGEGGTILTDDTYIKLSKEDVVAQMDAANLTEAWIGRYYTPWSWLKGCFTYTDDMLPERAVHFKSNQQSTCIEYCHDSNYFGLKGNKCLCFQKIEGKFVRAADYCNEPCPGNVEERCGGNTAMNVYMNDLCFNNSSLWNGTISTSRSGETCLPCNTSSPSCANASVENTDSFCRDPSNKGNTWCYTRNGPEDCDIPKCLGRTDFNGAYGCMAFREVSVSRIQARQTDCSKRIQAACQYQARIVATIPVTWKEGRDQCRSSSSSLGDRVYTMADTRNVLPDTGRDFWVGYRRTVKTASDISASFIDCFRVTRNENGILLTVDKCAEGIRAICQALPITCGETYSKDKRGKFSFPNTTRTYDPDHNCVWKIMATPPEKIEIYIEFDLEDSVVCMCDKIKLYDNDGPKGHANKTLCGRGNFTLISSGPAVVIQFISDESVNGTGFNVSWKVEKYSTAHSTTTVFDIPTSHTGLKVWLILVVFSGSVVFVVLMAVLVCYWRRRIRHRDEQSRNVTADTEPHNYEMLTTGSPISSYYNTLDIHEYDEVDQTVVSGRT